MQRQVFRHCMVAVLNKVAAYTLFYHTSSKYIYLLALFLTSLGMACISPLAVSFLEGVPNGTLAAAATASITTKEMLIS